MHLSTLILTLAPLTSAYIGTLYPWTPSGVGSCGTKLTELELSVALSKDIMDSSVGKSLCNHSINISVPHTTPASYIAATIVDTCAECGEGDLKVGETLYRMLAGATGLGGDGAEGVEWCL